MALVPTALLVINKMDDTVSTLLEIPKPINDALQELINQNPFWDEDKIFTVALCVFLINQGKANHAIKSLYLETLL